MEHDRATDFGSVWVRGQVVVFLALSLPACSGMGIVRDEPTAMVNQGLDGSAGGFVTQMGADTQIVENDSTNYGARSRISVRGNGTGAAPVMVGLIEWQLIPPSAASPPCTVTAAEIVLNVVYTSNQSYRLYPAGRDWSDGQTTWTNAQDPTTWEVPGAKGAADRGPAFLEFTPNALGPQILVLGAAGIALVQSWANFPSANKGIIVGQEGHGDGFAFASFDNATEGARPTLSYQCQVN